MRTNIALYVVLIATFLATLTTAAILLAKDDSRVGSNMHENTCPSSAVDTRCTIQTFNVTSARLNGDNRCSSQTCPDLKRYPSETTDFCTANATANGDCVEDIYTESTKIHPHCLLVCHKDPVCEYLPFDHTQLACGCPCQRCPDQKTYNAGIIDYTKADPADEANCPNVKYPLPKAQDVCSK